MLFLINSAGVPSVATFVQLGSTAEIDPPPPNTPPPPDIPLLPPPPGGSVPNCSGHAATVFVRDGIIVGGRDGGLPYHGRLRGTGGADVMVGTAGNDVLQGFGGNDWICAAPGNDS
jgi:RTX calcium-binding nonapeptide repeat (4 copies)